MLYIVYQDGRSDGSTDTHIRHIFNSYQDAVAYFGDRLGTDWDDEYPDGYWDQGSISDPIPFERIAQRGTNSYDWDCYGPGVMHGPEQPRRRGTSPTWETYNGLTWKDW